MSNDVWGVIAGGGTYGHLTPAMAAADALVARGCPVERLHFVGSRRGVEAERLADARHGVTLLPGRGIQRRLTRDNLGAALGLAQAAVQAFRLLRRIRPSVVLATGGYSSLSCALSAAVLRIPLIVAEQNAVPGAANRISARFARACAVSFPGTPLPRATLTGNPVRPEMLAVDRVRDRSQARAELGVATQRTLVVVFGGSLGARRLNEAALDLRDRWRDRDDLAVHHIVGDRDWDLLASRSGPRQELLRYRAVRFEAAMPTVFAAADLVVCRAGASTAAELAAVGLASILVPYPAATGDHQSANARVFVDAGAAVLVPDAEADAERLGAEVERLVADRDLLVAMGAGAASLGRRDAADRVAELMVRHATQPWDGAGPAGAELG